MKRIFTAAAALTLALAATTRPATAQSMDAARTIHFGIAGGATVPLGDLGDGYDTGYHLMGTLGLQPQALPVGVRFDIAYNNLGGASNSFVGNPDLKILSGTANLVLTTSNMSGIRPYVIGGLGVYNVDFGAADRENKFGLNGGAGLQFALSGFNTFVEARYHSIFTDNQNANMIPISFGIMF